MPKIPARLQEFDRIRRRFNNPSVRRSFGMPSGDFVGPSRYDAELWNALLLEEQQRRDYLRKALEMDLIAQNHFPPWQERRRFPYTDPYLSARVEFEGTAKDFYGQHPESLPRGIEWFDEAISGDAPYERTILPEELDVFQAESYGDPQLLNDIRGLERRWDRRPIPMPVPIRKR